MDTRAEDSFKGELFDKYKKKTNKNFILKDKVLNLKQGMDTIFWAKLCIFMLCGCSTTRLSFPIKGFWESVSNICLVPDVL